MERFIRPEVKSVGPKPLYRNRSATNSILLDSKMRLLDVNIDEIKCVAIGLRKRCKTEGHGSKTLTLRVFDQVPQTMQPSWKLFEAISAHIVRQNEAACRLTDTMLPELVDRFGGDVW